MIRNRICVLITSCISQIMYVRIMPYSSVRTRNECCVLNDKVYNASLYMCTLYMVYIVYRSVFFSIFEARSVQFSKNFSKFMKFLSSITLLLPLHHPIREARVYESYKILGCRNVSHKKWLLSKFNQLTLHVLVHV